MRIFANLSTALGTIGFAIASFSTSALAAEPLDFILNWKPGGDHAPIYWAKAEGWYEEAGIDLNILEGSGSGTAAKTVGVGKTPIGIMDLPTGLQNRGNGGDLVAVMNIYANSPYGIYWKKSSGISTHEDLVGKKLGNPPFDAARQMWPAISKVLGFEPDAVEFVNIKPNAKVAALTSGSIDATTHFYNVHYIYERIFGDDMGFVALRDLGFNPYGNSIVANGAWLEENQDIAKAFVQTTQRAYAACLENPTPCVEELARAGSQKTEDVMANWNLVAELMSSPAGGTLGSFDAERMATDYQSVADSFEIEAFDVNAAFTNDLLDTTVPAAQ